MPPIPAPDGPFTLADLRAEGLSRGLVRRRSIQHPHHGVHLEGPDELSLHERCAALARLLDDRHAFSHLTAARLWGIPLPWLADADALHVIAEGERGRVRRPGVVGWETERDGVRIIEHAGLRVVSAADTWAQLSGLPRPWSRAFALGWLVAIGDFLLTGSPSSMTPTAPLCQRKDLEDAVARRRGKRGVKLLALALELVRVGAQSPKESLLRVGLTEFGLPEPEIQLPIATAQGVRHSDLGYRRGRLLLEYQGDHHRTSRRQWLDDLTRVQLFEEAGYRVVLVGDADVYPDCRALAARVARLLGPSLARENA
jgi:hypothetical protein